MADGVMSQIALPLPDQEACDHAFRAVAPRSVVPLRFRYLVRRGGAGYAFTNRRDAAIYYAFMGFLGRRPEWLDRGRLR